MADEKFNLKTFILGKSGIKTWWETGGNLVRAIIILCIIALFVFGLRFLWGFFVKSNQNISKQKITVQSGGHVDNFTIQTTIRDRPDLRVYLYGDTSVGSAVGRHSNFEDNAEVRAVIGVRCEYDLFDWYGKESKAKQEVKQQIKDASKISEEIDNNRG